MPTKIKVLSDQAINQIAAGEVIENAASCVKELVENAIDANAGSIIVEVNASPLQLIRIVDDGSGMGRDDALLSLERHATSKIFSFSDLLKVTSMGFRGEALASIAAISKMTIITANEEGGTRLTACGGKILHVEECARNIGTTIEIRSLFYNVPARKKFQKTDSRSLIDIVNMLTKLSLAHPTISFKFYSQSKEMLLSKEFETEDFLVRLEKRMKDVLGNNFLQEKAPLQVLDLECKIEGFIGLPSLTRYNRRGQFLFINKRAIYCQAAVHAIYDGYGPRLQTGKHPLFVLHLTLPEELVDVNVHPQKKEVRLLDEPRIKNLLRKGIANSLQSIDGATLAPSFDRVEFLQEEAPRSMSYAPFVFKEEKDLLESEIVFFDRNQSSFEHSIIGMYQSYLLLDGCLFPKAEHILGKKEGLLMVDLLGVCARVHYERLLGADDANIAVEPLLIPVTLEFSAKESLQLCAYQEEIHSFGISFRSFGNGCFIIEAISSAIDRDSVQEILCELLESLDQGKKDHLLKRERQKKLALTTCKIASSKKGRVSLEEGKRLVQEFLDKEYSNQCPLGKPLIKHLRKDEIKKFFEKN